MKTFVDPIPREYSVAGLQLDPNNPRIRLYPGGSSNREIIERLCKTGSRSPSHIVKHILTDRGYLHNEAPILFKEGGKGKGVVIDGNRRVAALKMILDPSLVPSTFRGLKTDCEKLQGLVPEKIRCWVTRNKSDAQRIVYRAHNEGTKDWETLSKYSTHFDYFDKYQYSIAEISEITGSSNREVIKQINTWILVEFLIHHIDGYLIDSSGITSFERVTSHAACFPEILGIKTSREGIYQLPPDAELASIIHKIYEKSAKSSGLSRDVPNNEEGRRQFLEGIVPKGFRPAGKSTTQKADESSTEDKASKQSSQRDSDSSKSKSRTNSSTGRSWQALCTRKNVGKKGHAIFKEFQGISGSFPIASAALARAMVETTLKFHAKRLGCYSESPDQQKRGHSDDLGKIVDKLKDCIAKKGLPYSADLFSSISSSYKSVQELNDVLHKEGTFSARNAVQSSLHHLEFAVENLIKIEP